MAEVGSDIKNRVGHRALALDLFKERLQKFMKGELH
jgi:inosine/xanthosine triphosphate pyrophosphatase family protein